MEYEMQLEVPLDSAMSLARSTAVKAEVFFHTVTTKGCKLESVKR